MGELESMVLENTGGTAFNGVLSITPPGEIIPRTLLESALNDALQKLTDTDSMLIEAVNGSNGSEYDVLLIKTGRAINGTYYSAEVLRKATPLFEGVPSFADHPTQTEMSQRSERSIRSMTGRYRNPQFGQWNIRGKLVEGVKARWKIIAPWMRDLVAESIKAGEPDFLGFSLVGDGKKVQKIVEGTRVMDVEAIYSIASVDTVTAASAGGQLIQSTREQGEEDMGDTALLDQIRSLSPEDRAALRAVLVESTGAAPAAPPVVAPPVVTPPAATSTSNDAALEEMRREVAELRESQRRTEQSNRIDRLVEGFPTLTDFSKSKLKAVFADLSTRRAWEDEELLVEARSFVDYEARFTTQNPTPGAGSTPPVITYGDDHFVRMDKAMQGMFMNEEMVDGVRSVRSLKESYCRYTGKNAFEVTAQEIMDEIVGEGRRYSSTRDHTRLQESINRTTTFSYMFADNFYRSLRAAYAADPNVDAWRSLVSDVENISDFQTRHWSMMGGYGDMSTIIPEGATYPMLTSPADQDVSYTLSKHGGLDDVTFEAIVSDRFGAIRRIPQEMGRAAARSLMKFIMQLITTSNPVMPYDTTTLYHTNHLNTGTTALSVSAWSEIRQKMRDQVPYGLTDEVMGPRNVPKHIIVPNELESLAERIFSPSPAYTTAVANAGTDTTLDAQTYKGKVDVHVYDYLTDGTDYWAMADPQLVPTLVVGFLDGRQTPELFVQDSPTVGANFTADKVTFKVRFIYGAAILDHRAFYRMVVAGG